MTLSHDELLESVEMLKTGFKLGQVLISLLENQPKLTLMIAIARVFHPLKIPAANEDIENFDGYKSKDPQLTALLLELKEFVAICEDYEVWRKTGRLQ